MRRIRRAPEGAEEPDCAYNSNQHVSLVVRIRIRITFITISTICFNDAHDHERHAAYSDDLFTA